MGGSNGPEAQRRQSEVSAPLCGVDAQNAGCPRKGPVRVDGSDDVPLRLPSVPGSAHRLLNANKINCIRPDAFQDLQNLSLLSLYDNKIQSLAKGTFTSLRAIQTL